MAATEKLSSRTGGLPGSVSCPFCSSPDTRPLAIFGSLLMTSQYHCRRCNTTFEWVRREPLPETGPKPS